jgi:hypothetical protein
VSLESVKKIDEKFLRTGTREQFREAIIDSLNLFQQMSEDLTYFKRRCEALEDEVLVLKGEKKSLSSSHPLKRTYRFPLPR